MIIQIFSSFAKQSKLCTDSIENSCGECGRGLCDFSWLGTNNEGANEGFGLILEKDSHRMWRVVEIKRNSPADTDDIQLNDVVLSVNSRPMKVPSASRPASLPSASRASSDGQGLTEWDIKQFFSSEDMRFVPSGSSAPLIALRCGARRGCGAARRADWLASAAAPAGRSRWSCSLRLAAPSSSSPSSAPAAPPRARDLPPPPAAERLLCAWGPPAGRPRERVYYCLSPRDRWHDAPPGHGRPVFAATPPLSRCRRSLRAAGPCTGEPGRPAGSSQWAGPQARAGTQSRDMVTAGS